jgi:glycosyltransferase involved in cell wall biosynthesis
MKVLFLATYFPKPGNPTIGTWALEQAKAFHESPELEVKVLSGNPWFPKFAGRLKKGIQPYVECPSEYNWNGVEVFYPRMLLYPFSTLDFLTNRLTGFLLNIGWVTISKPVSEIIEAWSPDIVYAHHTIPNGFFARKIHDLYGIPYIVMDHEMAEITACDIFPARKREFSNVVEKAGLMIAGGEVMRRDMAKVFPDAPCEVVHYGFNLPQVSNELRGEGRESSAATDSKHAICHSLLAIASEAPNPSLPAISHQSPATDSSRSPLDAGPSTPLVILSCGMFYGRKNFPGLIQAFNQVAPDFPTSILRICGDGPDAPNVMAEVNRSPYKDRIEIIGKVSHQEVNKQMLYADIFALIGWREPFGVVYLEAMAAGLPVIACNDGGFADIVENGVDAFLVSPRDVQAAAEKLRLLLADPIIRKKIGSAGQEMALTKMTWGAITKKYIQIFEKAISGKNA